MVDEVQKQKQKPKRKVNSKVRDELKKSGPIRRLIEEIKNQEIKTDLLEGPAKVPFDPLDEKSMKDFMKRVKLLESAKGGMVDKYAKGGSVKKKNKMLTTKGWGASRKT
jgi:hypothetical protein